MRHVLAAIGTVIWFMLNGLLWYARPPDLVWLAGALALGALWFGGFFWYLMRSSD